jgi:hypothetical protein
MHKSKPTKKQGSSSPHRANVCCFTHPCTVTEQQTANTEGRGPPFISCLLPLGPPQLPLGPPQLPLRLGPPQLPLGQPQLPLGPPQLRCLNLSWGQTYANTQILGNIWAVDRDHAEASSRDLEIQSSMLERVVHCDHMDSEGSSFPNLKRRAQARLEKECP